MIMKFANNGYFSRKEGVYCMNANVIVNDVANIHPYEEDIKRVKC
jgi:hypothetical protein